MLMIASSGDGKNVDQVLLDGQAVTMDCVALDDEQGWAVLLKRNQEGRAYVAHATGCPNRDGMFKFIIHEPAADDPDAPPGSSRKLVALQPLNCPPTCGAAVELKTGLVEVTWRQGDVEAWKSSIRDANCSFHATAGDGV